METLIKRLEQANTLLAPYAVPHQGVLGRVFEDAPDETRFPFQRDRGRIMHTAAFRRLKGKTQVFVAGEGDHYRTRLTHTMEVALISRDIARTLSLNEDLAECIALAHDLGHPPFGHAGEEALNIWMQGHGSSFEHNEQSYRIVTTLAYHSDEYSGLNLNKEILNGLLKHHTPHDHPEGGGEVVPLTLEAALVNIADEIAYTAHDCDDGLREGLFLLEAIKEIPLAKQAHDHAQKRGTSLRGSLINMLVMDLYQASEDQLKTHAIATLEDVQESKETLIGFSAHMRDDLDRLRQFLWNNMYMHPHIVTHSIEGKDIVTAICTALFNKPSVKVLELQKQNDSSLIEAVKDYVSGMTDRFATEQSVGLD